MPYIDIEITARQGIHTAIKKEDLENKDFMRGYSAALSSAGFSLDSIGDKGVYGRCDGCEVLLMEDDDDWIMGEGCVLCKDCAEDMKKHYEAEQAAKDGNSDE